MLCDFCGQNESMFLIGNQTNGEQVAACPADAARWGLDLALAVLADEEITARLLTGAEAAENGEGAGELPAPKTETPEPETEAEEPEENPLEGEPETPAAPAIE